jgi:hypothetical protein
MRKAWRWLMLAMLWALAVPACAAVPAGAAKRPTAIVQGGMNWPGCATWWHGRLITATYAEFIVWDVGAKIVDYRVPIPPDAFIKQTVLAQLWAPTGINLSRDGRTMTWWYQGLGSEKAVPVTLSVGDWRVKVGTAPAPRASTMQCDQPSPDRKWVVAKDQDRTFVARAAQPDVPYLAISQGADLHVVDSFDLDADASTIVMLMEGIGQGDEGCTLRILETASMASREYPVAQCGLVDLLDDRHVLVRGKEGEEAPFNIIDFRDGSIVARLEHHCSTAVIAGVIFQYAPLGCAGDGWLLRADIHSPRWTPTALAARDGRHVFGVVQGPTPATAWLLSCHDRAGKAGNACTQAELWLLDAVGGRILAHSPLAITLPADGATNVYRVMSGLWLEAGTGAGPIEYEIALPDRPPSGEFVARAQRSMLDRLSPVEILTLNDALLPSKTLPDLGVRVVRNPSMQGLRFVRSTDPDNVLAELIPLAGNDFSVLTPFGTYDTNRTADDAGFRWKFPGEPHSLPPQMFMRDYFEPNLLRRRLDCTLPGNCTKVFRPAPDIASLNRVLPVVSITGITPLGEGRVRVAVAVRGTVDSGFANGKTRSGVYNLRLFRDDRLVAQVKPVPGNADPADRAAWRTATLMAAPGSTATQSYQFDVAVPRGPKQTKAVFSAYAFNEDQVKSATASRVIDLPAGGAPQRRLYLLTIGIDAYGGGFPSLRYAGSDAQAMEQLLRGLAPSKGAPAYEIHAENVIGSANDPATRVRIHDAFTRLAQAGPDDAVVISYAGHGYTDARGRFALVPSDAASHDGQPDPKTLITAGDLAEWLAPVDAGEIAFIIDACHSAASVSSGGFKPGPMGDPGLGQLAYDKGIRILAASQPDQYAMELTSFGHGLLTYALLQGAKGAADLDHNGVVRLDELLQYARDSLQSFAPAVASGEDGPPLIVQWKDAILPQRQRPSLFDYVHAPAPIGIVPSVRTREPRAVAPAAP